MSDHRSRCIDCRQDIPCETAQALALSEELRRQLALVREQRDVLARHNLEDAPCGDSRCYCGGCVL